MLLYAQLFLCAPCRPAPPHLHAQLPARRARRIRLVARGRQLALRSHGLLRGLQARPPCSSSRRLQLQRLLCHLPMRGSTLARQLLALAAQALHL